VTTNDGTAVEKSWPAKVKKLPQDVRAMQGVWLFLLMLGVFFASSILLYVLYVVLRLSPEAGMRPDPFYLPRSFVPSTILLLGVSGTLEWSLRAAKNNHSNGVRVASIAALILGLLFMAIQSEGMFRLVRASYEARSMRNSLYALTFVLAFLHALHVVGGIVGLFITAFNANRDKYDRERNFALRFCALYWHFLDVVWILLMASFIVASVCVNSPPPQ
jgi:cytochrome c oxidase subunit III